jgi:hypothetical protein
MIAEQFPPPRKRRLVTVGLREDVAESVLQILTQSHDPNAKRAEVRLAEALRKTQAPRPDRQSDPPRCRPS